MRWNFPSNPEIQKAMIELLDAQEPRYQMNLNNMYKPLGDCFNLTDEEREVTSIEVIGRGENRSYWENRVRTAKARLIDDGILYEKPGRGICKLRKESIMPCENNIPTPTESNDSPLKPSQEPPDTPKAFDINEPGGANRTLSTQYRILRDTALARGIKVLHQYRCQICGDVISLQNGQVYVEAHHIKPLGAPYEGPDIAENIICVCPNHHVQLDYGAIKLNKSNLRSCEGHIVDDAFINYHNEYIFGE